MKLTAKEIARASGGITIVSRPQGLGGYKVMAVHVDGTPLQGKAFEEFVEKKGDVPGAAKEIARWLSKLGFTNSMAEASRSRRK